MENGQSRLQQAQKDVDEVTVIMLDNLNKAKEREGKLTDLENRAEELQEKSKGFSKTARQVSRKKKLENMKWKLFLGGGVLFAVIIIIILASVLSLANS